MLVSTAILCEDSRGLQQAGGTIMMSLLASDLIVSDGVKELRIE